jgi:hypothetical protein
LNEFGATGYLVYDYIKTLCYKDNGYFLQYDDGFCFDVADVLKSGTTENSVKEILRGCFRMSLFDEKVFKAFRVITSKGIQERYLKAKKGGLIVSEYKCLVVNSVETPEKDDLSTQRKGKESKEKESKVFTPPSLDDVINFFKEKNYSAAVAKRAFEYYDAGGWKDGSGKQVRNWKQKMISVWFKEEHREGKKQLSIEDELAAKLL